MKTQTIRIAALMCGLIALAVSGPVLAYTAAYGDATYDFTISWTAGKSVWWDENNLYGSSQTGTNTDAATASGWQTSWPGLGVGGELSGWPSDSSQVDSGASSAGGSITANSLGSVQTQVHTLSASSSSIADGGQSASTAGLSQRWATFYTYDTDTVVTVTGTPVGNGLDLNLTTNEGAGYALAQAWIGMGAAAWDEALEQTSLAATTGTDVQGEMISLSFTPSVAGQWGRLLFGVETYGAVQDASVPVPVPPAIWLLGTALVGLRGARRLRYPPR